MSIPFLSSLDPIEINTSTSVANISFSRSDISDIITLTHTSTGTMTLTSLLNATGFIGDGSSLTGLTFSQLTSVPTTLAGYSIIPQASDYASFYTTPLQLAASKTLAIALSIALG